jgi:hypothetical protein
MTVKPGAATLGFNLPTLGHVSCKARFIHEMVVSKWEDAKVREYDNPRSQRGFGFRWAVSDQAYAILVLRSAPAKLEEGDYP